MKNAAKVLVIAILLISGISSAQVRDGKFFPVKSVTTNYYYLPDVQSYYDVKNNKYIYAKDGKWVTSTTLPAKYKNFNLKSSRKVQLTDKSAPYRNFVTHKTTYKKTSTTKKAGTRRPGNSANAPGHNKTRKQYKHD
ncbi:MAG TPA: hypothetical protein VF676_00235 [Flavobacterium sp.]|jgi:hypothetical protein